MLDTLLAYHDDIPLNPPNLEPRLSIVMSPTLEAQVWVLNKVRSNFWEPLGFHIVKLLLIHNISKHSHAFNGGQTNFNQEDMIGSISLYLEFLSNHLNISS